MTLSQKLKILSQKNNYFWITIFTYAAFKSPLPKKVDNIYNRETQLNISGKNTFTH